MADESIDIAIVGAGVSGVYSAWRLKTHDPAKRIVVFEGGRDVGGRLLSVRPPDIPDMVAELGGMRILPAVQPKITRLINVLNHEQPPSEKIELYDFPVDSRACPGRWPRSSATREATSGWTRSWTASRPLATGSL